MLRKATIRFVMSVRPTGYWLPQDGFSQAVILGSFINLVEEMNIRLKSGKSKRHLNEDLNYIYGFIYLAVCKCFHIFLRPCSNYIIFFLHLLLSVQSSSISPFSPIIPVIPSAQVSLGQPRFLLPDGRHFSTFLVVSPPPFFGHVHTIAVVWF